MIRMTTAALAYFATVFAAGFVLGTLRQLLLLRYFTDRMAELLEMPVMLLIAYLVAGQVNRRFSLKSPKERAATGFGALALLLAAEFLLVLPLRDLTPADYLATRDPVSGSAYAFSLVLFALMPLIVGGRTAEGQE